MDQPKRWYQARDRALHAANVCVSGRLRTDRRLGTLLCDIMALLLCLREDTYYRSTPKVVAAVGVGTEHPPHFPKLQQRESLTTE